MTLLFTFSIMLSRLTLITFFSLVLVLPVHAATFTVDSVADTGDFLGGDGVCDTDDSVGDGPCTLRAAIEEANNGAAMDDIEFGLAGPGPFTFTPTTAYPGSNNPVSFDGTTQAGATCGTDAGSRNLLISIDFSAVAGTPSLSLSAGADSSVIAGLNIFGAGGASINVNADDVTIRCNHLGTNLAGTAVGASPSDLGINASSADDLQIGGDSFAELNVISGTTTHGIQFLSGNGMTISRNHIGVDLAGTDPIPNGGLGINLFEMGGIDNIDIGGSTANEGNIISANTGGGINALDSSNLTIENNYIGVDINGDMEGNGGQGILVRGSDSESTKILNNVVSNSAMTGIFVDATSNTLIRGNLVGVSPDGLSDHGNGASGIAVLGAYSNVRVGGTDSSHRNIVSGNVQAGIFTSETTGTVLLIEGNYVGTDINGTAAISNDGIGIIVNDTANGIRIGGTSPGAGNVVSGNDPGGFGTNGIMILGDDVIVQGNIVGLDATGLNPLPNTTAGIVVDGSSDVVIGGDTPAARNIVSANGFAGIALIGEGGSASDITVQGNYVGTDINGDPGAGLANGFGGGIALFGDVQDSLIGGTNSGEGNLVTNNPLGIHALSFVDSAEIPINNSFLNNSIFNNSSIGIDLSVDTSVGHDFSPDEFIANNPNDFGDGDAGPNDLLNHPEPYLITDVGGGNVRVDYFLDVPAGDYRIEFFRNTALDPTFLGEGETFVAADTVTHTGTGVELFSSTFAAAVSDNITVTATEVLSIAATCDENVYYYHFTTADWTAGLVTPLGGDTYTVAYDFANSTEADRFEEVLGVLANPTGARADEFVPAAATNFYLHEGHFSNIIRVDADTVSADFDLSVANDVPAALPGSCTDPYLLADYATSNAAFRASYDGITAGQTAPGANPVVEFSVAVHTFEEFTSRFASTSEFSSTASTSTTGLDFGDNPDAAAGTAFGDYETRMVDNGAYHTIGNVYLGSCVDADNGTLQNTSSLADDSAASTDMLGTCAVAGDDEDGVTLPNPFNWGAAETIVVVASGPGELNGWIDVNNNGDFSDAGEQLFTDVALVAGTNSLPVNVPPGAGVLSTYGRFRFNSTDVNGATFVLGPTGESLDGEVEDYPIAIVDAGTASIGDLIWEDLNSDGILGAVETGIDGVTVDLYLDDGDGVYDPIVGDPLLATQTTAGGGLYNFINLAPGDYWVNVSDQNAVLTSYNKVTGATLPELITVSAGELLGSADYGYLLPSSSSGGGSSGGGGGGSSSGGGLGTVFNDLVKENQPDNHDDDTPNNDPIEPIDETVLFACDDIFNDTSGHMYETDICFLYNVGVLQGRGGVDGIFLPRDPENYTPSTEVVGSYFPDMGVNRVEFLKMLLSSPEIELLETNEANYTDVTESDWFYKYVDHGTAAGFVEGYKDGTFKPGEELLNAEALSMLVKTSKDIPSALTDGEQESILKSTDQWFEEGLNTLRDNEKISQYFDGPLHPAEVLSRGKAAHVIRAIFYSDSL